MPNSESLHRRPLRPILTALLLAVLAGAAAPEEPEELPPLPSGFSWLSIEEIQAHFKLPDGWSFQRIDAALDLDWVLTPKPIERLSDLEKGFRVSVLFDTERKKGFPASTFGKATADLFEDQGNVQRRWHETLGPFEITSLVIEPADGPCCLTFFQIFANTETDTLYWISFFSSIDSWEEDWERFGSEMYSGFRLETEV